MVDAMSYEKHELGSQLDTIVSWLTIPDRVKSELVQPILICSSCQSRITELGISVHLRYNRREYHLPPLRIRNAVTEVTENLQESSYCGESVWYGCEWLPEPTQRHWPLAGRFLDSAISAAKQVKRYIGH